MTKCNKSEEKVCNKERLYVVEKSIKRELKIGDNHDVALDDCGKEFAVKLEG